MWNQFSAFPQMTGSDAKKPASVGQHKIAELRTTKTRVVCEKFTNVWQMEHMLVFPVMLSFKNKLIKPSIWHHGTTDCTFTVLVEKRYVNMILIALV